MPWTLDKAGVTPSVDLSNAEQENLNDFMNNVRNGQHPSTAGSRLTYKKLQGTQNQYEIRLSKGTRATFTVDEAAQRVTMLQVGGHT